MATNSPAILCTLTSVFAAIPSVQGHLNELWDTPVSAVSASTVSAQVALLHVVFVVRASNGRKLALKRLAVNNDADVYLTKQEIAVTKALSDCSYSVTYISSITKQISSDVHEVLILMELYTGTSVIDLLNQRLSAGTQLRQREVLHIFSNVSKAVARLHHRTKPIIHRDLKIENILHDSVHDTYILCDYGSCSLKSMHPEEMGATECSDEISRFTTMPYRSPEMVSVYSGKTITTKSDIWALGVLLFKLCFMDTPFGDNPLAIVSAQYSIPEDSPYTQDLHNLIAYLLTSDPELRPSIWQVCEVVSRITGTTNHVTNVFTGSSFPTDDFGSTSFDGRSSTPPTHNTADNAR